MPIVFGSGLHVKPRAVPEKPARHAAHLLRMLPRKALRFGRVDVFGICGSDIPWGLLWRLLGRSHTYRMGSCHRLCRRAM